MSDPLAAVRIAFDRDHDVGEAALRGMRIELAAWLTDEIYECNWLFHEQQSRKPGYLRSWRWRVGCRLRGAAGAGVATGAGGRAGDPC